VGKRRGIDLSRLLAVALETALNEDEPAPRRPSTARALVAGAVLAAGARVAMSKIPTLPRLPDLTELTDSVRDRLTELGLTEPGSVLSKYGRLDEEPDLEEHADLDEPESVVENLGRKARVGRQT
jgi:hypothetical protein